MINLMNRIILRSQTTIIKNLIGNNLLLKMCEMTCKGMGIYPPLEPGSVQIPSFFLFTKTTVTSVSTTSLAQSPFLNHSFELVLSVNMFVLNISFMMGVFWRNCAMCYRNIFFCFSCLRGRGSPPSRSATKGTRGVSRFKYSLFNSSCSWDSTSYIFASNGNCQETRVILERKYRSGNPRG